MTEAAKLRYQFTLWSRVILRKRTGPWEQEAIHREKRCWELADYCAIDQPHREWLVLPPGEKP